jgi:hypothetical protein
MRASIDPSTHHWDIHLDVGLEPPPCSMPFMSSGASLRILSVPPRVRKYACRGCRLILRCAIVTSIHSDTDLSHARCLPCVRAGLPVSVRPFVLSLTDQLFAPLHTTRSFGPPLEDPLGHRPAQCMSSFHCICPAVAECRSYFNGRLQLGLPLS